MITYYIVILWVVVFAGIAEQLDITSVSVEVNARIALSNKSDYHTLYTCYAFVISSLVLILVAGLRYYVGADYGGYYNRWGEYADSLGPSILKLDEPGYRLICMFYKIVKVNDGAYPLFTASAITIGLSLYIIYNNSHQLFLASILYVLIYWTAGFNAVRQSLAATFVFCGFSAIRDKKLWEYIEWVGIAFLFHRSAICMLFPYFFIHKEISIKNMILLILGCIIFLNSYDIAFNFTGAILDKEFNLEELQGYNFKEVNRLRILFYCFPAATFFIWTILQKRTISDLHKFWMNILLFRAAISLAAMNSPYLSRMGIYFSPFVILAYCGLINFMPKQNRKIISFGLIIYCGIFFLYEISHSTTMKYYRFIWER